MNPRDIILAAVRKNLPEQKVPLPALSAANEDGSTTRTGYKQLLNIMPGVQKLPHSGESLVPNFRQELEKMGGRSFEVASAAAAQAKIAELFPTAKVVCSAVPEVPGTSRVQDVSDPHMLNNVDVGVVRSPLGVAEAGAVWLTENELVVNALGVLSQHLVVLLDPAAIVETVHDAYGQLDFTSNNYGVFMAGPSGTGDVEGVIIHGAQCARSMTVLLLAPA